MTIRMTTKRRLITYRLITYLLVTFGLTWGLWHAPITMMGHNYGRGYPGFPFTGIFCMVVFCTSLSVCLSYLRVRTTSVWSCAITHGALNAIAGVGIYFCLAGSTPLGPSPAGLVGGIPLAALAVAHWLQLSDGKSVTS